MKDDQKITINADGGFNQTKIIENLILLALEIKLSVVILFPHIKYK